jgi:GrpB-like predicted nucleotidyltransferase (UPF0157 family)
MAPSIVEVVEYDPSWPGQFAAEKARLVATVPGLFVSVEHIGSTAVPGLVAKPTLDILGVVDDVRKALGQLAGLELAGYEYRPGAFRDDDTHLFFRKMKHDRRTHHLHVLAATSPEVDDYRLFRDFLIAHPDAARRYGSLKLELVRRFGMQRSAYVETKQRYVERLMEQARRWRWSPPPQP